ncbi:MAG: hypothetical protein JWM43_3902 [Acidobacteriaceae bacterium]|nr:hypothetical protein [Acidobacteriaceae bacterium]
MTTNDSKPMRWKIQIGDVFSLLTVIDKGKTINGRTRWMCRCSCGEVVEVLDNNLKKGLSKSCGHVVKAARAVPEEHNSIFMHRSKWGLLPICWIPAKESGGDPTRGHWVCLRGARFVSISTADYLKGRRQNAGKGRGRKPTTSLAYRKTRQCWRDMKRRCRDTEHKYWDRYGGRGVDFDPMWKDFKTFLEQMGETPTGLQLDRINTNGHYIKGNCRWVTPEENSHNRNPRNSGEEPHILERIPSRIAYVPYVGVPYGSDGITV